MESVPDLGTPIVGIRPGSAWQSIINSFLAFVIVIATYPTWSPFFWNVGILIFSSHISLTNLFFQGHFKSEYRLDSYRRLPCKLKRS